ncbi:MAG: S-layer homology domain-containing protein [Ruminococcaceae bacterium]|nr:S-layer homology domain-containing protein [Oscillospiraceae bacterium]
MSKKWIGGILSAIMLITAALPVAGAIFPDVTEDHFGWAQDAVEEMVKDGIIKGYTDNTFKPERTVTKEEALVLSARLLGYTNETVEPFTELAAEFYADILEKYETSYKGEVAYLLYKDVLTERELSYYIGGDNAKTGMKRYEVAKLLTRVMGGESQLDLDATTNEYTDSSDIPADAKPYVRFVTDAQLMNGMDGGRFEPMGDVNRAQIATLLYRVKNLTNEEYIFASVLEVNTDPEKLIYLDEDESEAEIKVPYEAEVFIKQNGYSVDFSKLSLGADVLITTRDGVLYALDTITREPDAVFEGAISSVVTGTKKTISVFPIEDQTAVTTYPISETVSITYEGNTGKLSDLKRLQAVKLQIKNGEVVIIEAKESERSIKGTIENIALSPVLSYSVRLASGVLEEYPVSGDVKVTRNGSTVTASDVLVGDKVTVTLRYEEVAVVTATSSQYITEGYIEEITIATLPSVKIRTNNTINAFSLSRECVYTVDGKEGTVYDLRLGALITASVDSETIVSLTTTAPTTTSSTTGVIETINTSYGFFSMIVTAENGTSSSMQVFTKRPNLQVIDSTDGSTKKVSNLETGMKVNVTGVTSSGAFEATAIIIMPKD